MKDFEKAIEIREYIQELCRKYAISHQSFVPERNEKIIQETMKHFQISREEAEEHFFNNNTLEDLLK